MILKLPLTAAIAAGATTTVAASPNNLRVIADPEQQQQRSLQGSALCIAGGGAFTDCCPGPAADPNDGICTMLWCVDLDDMTVRDTCDCAEIETACTQVAVFSAAVPGLEDMCAAANGCCSGGTATNPDWDTCMETKAADGDYVTPNFDNLIPGGIPDLSAVPEPVQISDPAVPVQISQGPCPATLDKMEVLDDRTTLYYAIVPASSWDADDGILCARMEVEGEQWVGFGISEAGKMVGSLAIIGSPDDGKVMKYDLEKGLLFREANVVDESEQNLMDTSLTVEDGVTIMKFAKKLVEPDEIPILEVGDNIFLWAYGKDNTVAYHDSRGIITKNFMDDIDMTEPAATTAATAAAATTVAAATTAANTDADVTTMVDATTTMAKATQAPPVTGPPASMACFLGQKPFMECCPAIDPNDGICTLLWCVDTEDLIVRDNCECSQVLTSCGQLSMFEASVEGLKEMCGAATSCCTAGETANEDFDTCMGAAKDDFEVPDFSGMIAGGLPDFDTIEPADTTTAATETAVGATTAATTAATEATTAVSEPAGSSGGSGVCVATGAAATMSLLAAMALA